MASQTSSSTIGYQTPRSYSATPLRGWWSRPILTYPATNDRKPTDKEQVVCLTPCCGGLVTIIAVYLILSFIDNANSHAKFSIQSIHVSPDDDSTWHVDFLVKNPSSRYSVYYDGDDVSVRLGPLNAAVLNITHKRESRDLTAFSLVFVAEEGNKNNVVSEELDVKLRGKHKLYVDDDEAGHFDIRCQSLNLSNGEKFCQSSFTLLDLHTEAPSNRKFRR